MDIFDMKIVEIKFVEIVTEGKFVEIKIRRNKMIYSNHLPSIRVILDALKLDIYSKWGQV